MVPVFFVTSSVGLAVSPVFCSEVAGSNLMLPLVFFCCDIHCYDTRTVFLTLIHIDSSCMATINSTFHAREIRHVTFTLIVIRRGLKSRCFTIRLPDALDYQLLTISSAALHHSSLVATNSQLHSPVIRLMLPWYGIRFWHD